MPGYTLLPLKELTVQQQQEEQWEQEQQQQHQLQQLEDEEMAVNPGEEEL